MFYNGGLLAENLDSLAYRSTFLVQFGAPTMHFRVDTAATIDPPLGGGGGGGGAVPEPASWAMLVIGFSLVGAGLRRRTRANAIAA